jgi:hypothetical protein
MICRCALCVFVVNEDEKSFVICQQGQMIPNMVPERCLSPEQMTTLRDLLSRQLAYEAYHVSVPLSRKHPDDWYWYEYLSNDHALYIQ